MRAYRLLILGAGFSRPAGLPLGAELFAEVRRRIKDDLGHDNHVERDLKRFVEFQQRCFDRVIRLDAVDCEEFLGFLDVEHYLGLKGKDTWSSEGNESQLMIRKAIGQVIHSRTPEPTKIPDVYRRFAGQLTAGDYILTFNYDTLLERTFSLLGIPYRLFPDRYSEVHPFSCAIDKSGCDEVALIKLHGSIDWFCKDNFDEHVKLVKEAPHMYPNGYQPDHPIFGRDAIVSPISITEGPRPDDEPLRSLYRVAELGKVLSQPWWKCSPFVLSPSTSKLFYARNVLDFWRGLERAGGMNLSFGIVGYSLPKYDDYALLTIYHIARNYQHYEPDLTLNGRQKTKVRMIDLKTTDDEIAVFQDRYRFLDWSRSETYFSGFDSKAVDWLMR